MHPLLDLVSDADLRAHATPGTLERARGYAEDGRVLDVEVEGDGPERVLLGSVVLGGQAYAVDAEVQRDAGRVLVHGQCTCPVGWMCKHVLATLLQARDGLPPHPPEPAPAPEWEGPDWSRTLEDLIRRASRTGVGGSPLALRLELRHVRPYAARGVARQLPLVPMLTLRPLQRGARQRWIQSGVGWRTAASMSRTGQHDAAQAEAIAALADGAAGHYVTDAMRLDDFGPALWPLLREAIDAGVTLVAAGELDSCELAPATRVDLDVRTAGPGAGTRLRGVLRGHEGAPPGSRLRLLGRRPHGAVLLTPVDPGSGGGSGSGDRLPGERRWRALLAPLEGPPDAVVRSLLETEEELLVPAVGSEALRATYLPELARVASLVSGDGSVEIPEPEPPRLVLTVSWEGPGRAGLAWAWRYPAPGRAAGEPRSVPGEVTSDVPIDDAGGAGVRRDPAAEAAVLDGLGLDEATRALVCAGPAGDGAATLVPRRTLGNDEVLALAGEVLPALREHPAVDVEEVGAHPRYRPAEQEPIVAFDVVDAAGDPGGDDAGAADAGEAGGAGAAHTDWLDLAVRITVDGEEVPLALVLEALTRGQDRVILPSGLHVATDHPAFLRLADAVAGADGLRRQGAGPGARGATAAHDDEDSPRLRVGREDLGSWAELSDIGSVDERAADWVRCARALRDLEDLPELSEGGLACELRSYQRDGARWLAFLWEAGLGGILADDMGLGKTLQALALVAHARERGAAPFLVVVPTSVVGNWVAEAARHAPGLRVRSVTGSGRRRGTTIAEETADADVLVTSYTLLRLEAQEYAALGWGGLLLDEAQHIKNHRGKTHQAVRRIDAPFRLALTGTPFENRLLELWALLSIVAPGLYPTRKAFVDQVATPVEKQGDEAALGRFRRRVRPFLLRRTKDLVAPDLPAKQEQVLAATLEPRHRAVYDAHLQRERQHVLGLVAEDFDRHRIEILSALTRLRQLSLDPGLVDPDADGLVAAKVELLVEHLHEVAEGGHRALVFSQFTRFLGRVRERLRAEGLECCYLDGTTRDRPAAIRDFREGDAPAFLISLKAGGVGLTLTEADYVFVLDPWWNPAAEAQAVDRAHRIGQTRPVVVYRLVATDTIEEKVMELKARKAALFDQVVDGDGALAQAVTAEDVRDLVGG